MVSHCGTGGTAIGLRPRPKWAIVLDVRCNEALETPATVLCIELRLFSCIRYETGTTRAFLHGRTATIRSLTEESRVRCDVDDGSILLCAYCSWISEYVILCVAFRSLRVPFSGAPTQQNLFRCYWYLSDFVLSANGSDCCNYSFAYVLGCSQSAWYRVARIGASPGH